MPHQGALLGAPMTDPRHFDWLEVWRLPAPRGSRRPSPSPQVIAVGANPAEIAAEAGGIVRRETRETLYAGCKMFSDINADIYIIVDGDATYESRPAPCLLDASFQALTTWATSGARRKHVRYGFRILNCRFCS